MKRTIIKIDESLCNGCGLCISGCHEGALQLIDGKARMISELYCDGLGACIGECPEGAITLEEREAEPYDEIAVMERISKNGAHTVEAHLRHLKDHNEMDYLRQGMQYLLAKGLFPELTAKMKSEIHASPVKTEMKHNHGGGCPGSMAVNFGKPLSETDDSEAAPASQLRQWPVQLHLLNPEAAYFQKADVVLAADCAAFAHGNFHNEFLKGKTLAIACPKLDTGKEVYIEKLKAMIDNAQINTLTVVIMEVPCCGGLLQMAMSAAGQTQRKVPVKAVTVSIRGEVIDETWVK